MSRRLIDDFRDDLGEGVGSGGECGEVESNVGEGTESEVRLKAAPLGVALKSGFPSGPPCTSGAGAVAGGAGMRVFVLGTRMGAVRVGCAGAA